MTSLNKGLAAHEVPSIESLVEVIDAPLGRPENGDSDSVAAGEALTYRSSPDGSVTIGTDPNSGQVVLILETEQGLWEAALPATVEHYVVNAIQTSFAGAKRLAETAFAAHFEEACP